MLDLLRVEKRATRWTCLRLSGIVNRRDFILELFGCRLGGDSKKPHQKAAAPVPPGRDDG